MKKILVLGGRGYIGSALCDNLFEKGHKVCSVDLEWFGNPCPIVELDTERSSSNYRTIRRRDYNTLTEEEIKGYDVVVLVAAHSSVSMCQRDSYGAFQNNISNFANLIKKISPGQKLIYASSSCVYTGIDKVATEDSLLLPPCDYLTLTKQTIDNIARLSDVEFYGMRFGSVAGWSPNLRSDLMVNAMVLNGLSESVVRVSNGQNYRPILWIEDLCRAVQAIIECEEDRRGIYNLSNFNVAINTVGLTVSTMTEAKLEILENTTSYDFKMDSSRFCDTFGFEFTPRITTIISSLISKVKDMKDCPTSYAKGRDVNKEYVLEYLR